MEALTLLRANQEVLETIITIRSCVVVLIALPGTYPIYDIVIKYYECTRDIGLLFYAASQGVIKVTILDSKFFYQKEDPFYLHEDKLIIYWLFSIFRKAKGGVKKRK